MSNLTNVRLVPPSTAQGDSLHIPLVPLSASPVTRLAFRLAEERFEPVPIGGSAAVGSGDGQVDPAAIDGPCDSGTLRPAVDLAAEAPRFLIAYDSTQHATANEATGCLSLRAEEPCRVGVVAVAAQCGLLGMGWSSLEPDVNVDVEVR